MAAMHCKAVVLYQDCDRDIHIAHTDVLGPLDYAYYILDVALKWISLSNAPCSHEVPQYEVFGQVRQVEGVTSFRLRMHHLKRAQNIWWVPNRSFWYWKNGCGTFHRQAASHHTSITKSVGPVLVILARTSHDPQPNIDTVELDRK